MNPQITLVIIQLLLLVFFTVKISYYIGRRLYEGQDSGFWWLVTIFAALVGAGALRDDSWLGLALFLPLLFYMFLHLRAALNLDSAKAAGRFFGALVGSGVSFLSSQQFFSLGLKENLIGALVAALLMAFLGVNNGGD